MSVIEVEIISIPTTQDPWPTMHAPEQCYPRITTVEVPIETGATQLLTVEVDDA